MKKYLAVFLALCVFSAFPGAANCQCVGADCGSIPSAIQAKTPQCHREAAPAEGESPFGKECCGKCRIEKAAVFFNELSPINNIRTRNAAAEIESFADFYSKSQRPLFSRGESFESPPGFFEEHILNTTFSFRAPPLAVVL